MSNFEILQKFDVEGMHKIYDQWPAIADSSYKSDLVPVDFKEIDHIVFSGMGGSGSLGDIFSSILSQTNVHVSITKGYHLPKTVDENTLIVATSVSGNTKETLSVLDSALKTKSKIVAFSDGGKFQEFCSKNNLEYRQIPMIHSPRSSFSKFLYSMIKILEQVIPVKHQDIIESISELKKTREKISSSNINENNPSWELAKWISGIPIVYYPWGFQSAAIRFKNSMQENAKRHIIAEDVIETCHNGIIAWEQKSNVQPILLEGKDDFYKTKERWVILKDFFNQKGIDFKEVFSVEGSILSKIINLVYLLDYCTIYRAVLSGIDPSPIKSIDSLKKLV